MTDEEVKTQVEGLVTAAYSALGNDHYDVPFSLWPYGNVRSDDAYKGGGDLNDIGVFHFYEISQNIQPTFGEPDKLWFSCFQGISRTNNALRLLKESSLENKNERMGEMYFILFAGSIAGLLVGGMMSASFLPQASPGTAGSGPAGLLSLALTVAVAGVVVVSAVLGARRVARHDAERRRQANRLQAQNSGIRG